MCARYSPYPSAAACGTSSFETANADRVCSSSEVSNTTSTTLMKLRGPMGISAAL